MLNLAALLVLMTNLYAVLGCESSIPPGRHFMDIDCGQFLLIVPETNRAARAAPLVVDFHGYSESPYYQDALVGLSEAVQKRGWYGILPFGTPPVSKPGPTECCPGRITDEECFAGKGLDQINACSFNAGSCCGVASLGNTKDVEFTTDLVEWAVENLCVDEKNVFATGFSNGGMMSNRVGCELSHTFRGVAPVSGNLKTNLFGDFPQCRPTHPVSWLSVCGDKDGVCNSDFEETALMWADLNGCSADRVTTVTTATTICQSFKDCPDDVFVEYCEVQGLDHEWSGRPRPDGTSTPQDPANIDATSYIFERFASLVDA